jgi:hypothetical protein
VPTLLATPLPLGEGRLLVLAVIRVTDRLQLRRLVLALVLVLVLVIRRVWRQQVRHSIRVLVLVALLLEAMQALEDLHGHGTTT